MRLWPNTVDRMSLDWCMPSRYITRMRSWMRAPVRRSWIATLVCTPSSRQMRRSLRWKWVSATSNGSTSKVASVPKAASAMAVIVTARRREVFHTGTTSSSAPSSVTDASASSVPVLPSDGIRTNPAPAAPAMAPHTLTE